MRATHKLKLLILFAATFLFISCDLNKWNLNDQDNKLIPNYSITITTNSVSPFMHSDIIPLDDKNVVMAIQDTDLNIKIIKINQDFVEDNWRLTQETLLDVGKGNLTFFDSIASRFIVGSTDDLGFSELRLLDKDFNLSLSSSDFETFIDTFYNNIDSLHLTCFSQELGNKEILAGGVLYSQGTSYSCLLKLDDQLTPKWVRTYFEESTIIDVVSINQDSFLLLNTNSEGTDLILDKNNSNAYKKYDLSNDQLFFGGQTFFEEGKIFLTGVHNNIGRIIEVDINTNSSFVNDIELYPVRDFVAVFLDRDNIVTAGIQVDGQDQFQFSSELERVGSKWCHKYTDETYYKILDIVEMPGKGILISSIVEQEGSYFIHLTRIDEEGATFVNEYSENCI